jgi:hypothetical protein
MEGSAADAVFVIPPVGIVYYPLHLLGKFRIFGGEDLFDFVAFGFPE